ncbi:hypothetical protein DM860_012991 [Cuscuta australis]|uniref:WRKY domain-containing protein n=1 Tax=Cuscuta australis TaxID=267555 RepID=A0A328DYI7_9ASTE|nr:hypothetical protein DM860_012991 [Cuscuta australis]
MGKGWGLTLENPPDHHQSAGFFVNKPVFGFNLSPRLNHMNSGSSAAASPPSEVDFFSEKKPPADLVVKNEANSLGFPPTKADLTVNTGLQLVIANTGSDRSTLDESASGGIEERRAKNDISGLQAELERMNAENQRLRGMLSQVSNNYSSLQLHLATLIQQQQQQRDPAVDRKPEREETVTVPMRQFLELGPADQTEEAVSRSRTSSGERTLSAGSSRNKQTEPSPRQHSNSKLGVREESPDSESWVPSKLPRLSSSSCSRPVEQAAEATMRKARVSVRARSEAPMISDGCQWRKYGQKMAKGNPCPRAYYRCTMAMGCLVRKQVQRCAEDRTILITTYEGTHNHPLPPAAMAMASTTSAAASMLLSGSMPSSDGMMNPNFLARAILPCTSSMATISASAPFPTVTLDLTQNPNTLPNYPRPPACQFPPPFRRSPSYSPKLPPTPPSLWPRLVQPIKALRPACFSSKQFHPPQQQQQQQLSRIRACKRNPLRWATP